MHHAPTSTELNILSKASNEERLDYFLTRAMESEEVWGLSNQSGWVMREEENGSCILPVWSYSTLSQSCAQGDWASHTPDSVSLEHFVYRILVTLKEQQIQLEVLPSQHQSGLLIKADSLFEIFERKLDAVEYFLES